MIFIQQIHPCTLAFMAGCFTWSLTALGALMVYFFKEPKKFMMDAMLGFASGVMIAASCFSLLIPALDLATQLNMNAIMIVSSGFLCGGLLLFGVDQILVRVMSRRKEITADKRKIMLMTSITMHNIPEGLAVGVGFGALLFNCENSAWISALMLTLGIGLQNFPEGTAVSVPFFREGIPRKKAFFYGQLSGIVEPISAFFGALLVLKVQKILPFMLSFAAGAMIYVVVEELIPESQTNERKDFMALFTLLGFTTMMILDILFK